MNSKKKYILKPGRHQFAPRSPAIHDNENLTDEEAEWYLERYPHIKTLFTPQPPEGGENKEKKMKVKTKKSIPDKELEGAANLTPPSGGKGGI